MKELIKKAESYAEMMHKGQFRKVSGERYFSHPLRVSDRVKTDFQKVCALLHDVVEDTPATIEDVQRKFGEDVAYVVDLLTHKKGESYQDYISKLSESGDAIEVKVADICDNITDNPSKRFIEKTILALPILFRELLSAKE